MSFKSACFSRLILLLIPYCVFSQPSNEGYEIETIEIDGLEYGYIRDELLVKPATWVNISQFAIELDASILDSIPEIGWYRLRLFQNQDAAPVWHGLTDDARIQSCELHLILPMDSEGTINGSMESTRGDPPEEIQPPTYITRANEAWGQIPQSEVLIAILDTGVDQAHVMASNFKDRIESKSAETGITILAEANLILRGI